ncbi:MAG TPA: hypothetical protein VFP84_16815 [Kofleriaceae bacterium]|nr:hypothetical protein [Kofleriaceae bacterium]
MFWSKIWFFLVALAGAVALTLALVMPRPAERALVGAEANRLQTACSVIHILLADDARNRVELAGAFARDADIMNALDAASTADKLDEARMKQVRDLGDTVMKKIQGSRKPDFAMLVDKRGRVVARVRLDDAEFGDVAAGRPLIDDALAGYLRDDIWAQNGTMYFVSASPVVKQGAYVGAVVLGHQVTNQLAQALVKPLDVDMGFHLGSDGVAGSRTIAFDDSKLQAELAKLTGEPAADCQVVKTMEVHAGADNYTAIAARLPGEAAARHAYYSVLIKRPDAIGMFGTLKAVTKNDLALDHFPWILVGAGFLAALALGIALMFLEADRPLRRLTADAVRLAKGEADRLHEDLHGGKHGSIARSVNIHIDKLGREAKSAKKDLDQLLGPAPEASAVGVGGVAGFGFGSSPGSSGSGTIDLLAAPLPKPAVPASAVPPPSEFRFQDVGAADVRLADPAGPPASPASDLRMSDSGATMIRKPPVRGGSRARTPRRRRRRSTSTTTSSAAPRRPCRRRGNRRRAACPPRSTPTPRPRAPTRTSARSSISS